jgi:hypothetical protein
MFGGPVVSVNAFESGFDHFLTDELAEHNI